jgi:excisionase family DNA binding protein
MASEQTHMADEQLWTYADVGRLLGLSEDSIRRRVKDGSIPAIRMGTRIRFRPATIRRILEEREESKR